MELKKYGVEEITSKEKVEITGGDFWEELQAMWDDTPWGTNSHWTNMGSYWQNW